MSADVAYQRRSSTERCGVLVTYTAVTSLLRKSSLTASHFIRPFGLIRGRDSDSVPFATRLRLVANGHESLRPSHTRSAQCQRLGALGDFSIESHPTWTRTASQRRSDVVLGLRPASRIDYYARAPIGRGYRTETSLSSHPGERHAE